MSSHNKDKNSKHTIRLGKKVGEEYKFHSKVDFKEDISVQIDKLMQELNAKDALENHLLHIRENSKQFEAKEKNIDYYWEIGKLLSFLDTSAFRNIKPYSVCRRIVEEIPDIISGVDKKRAVDHLIMMYRIGHLPRKTLQKASWEQWYEISKFKGLTKDEIKLDAVLAVAGKLTGPDLREKVKSIIKNK